MKLPKTIGTCCDNLLKLRDARLAMQKEIDELKDQETELKAHTAKMMKAQHLDKSAGKRAIVSLGTQAVANIADWPAFFGWMTDNQALDMVQRRINNAAFRDRLAEGEDVPTGLKRETVLTFSLTRKR